MTRTRVVFFAILLAAVGLGLFLIWRSPAPPGTPGEKQITGDPIPEPPLAAPVEVVIANAQTKQRWFEDLAASFQAEGRKTSKGNPIKIISKPVLSGGSMDDILAGKLKPVVWSPGVASWV